MKNDTFEIAIRDLKTVDQNQLVGQLQKVFHAITQFDADQTVSTFQALSFMGEVFEGEDGNLFIERVKQAVVNHMIHLSADSTELRLYGRRTLQRRFEQAVGQKLNVPNDFGRLE